MIKRSIFTFAATWSLSSSVLFGAALVVNMDSGGLDLQNLNGVSLTAGGPTTAYDGAAIQLGYFSGASSGNNNFNGQFIPLTGVGSANFAPDTKFDTTVGDDFTQGFGPPFDGQFQISLVFDTALHTALPPVGTVLSIRVFDSSVITPTAKFMTISSNLWVWKTPGSLTDPNSRVDLSFADAGIRMEDRLGPGGAISTPSGTAVAPGVNPRTTLAVPEPSSMLLLSVAGVGFLFRRSRK